MISTETRGKRNEFELCFLLVCSKMNEMFRKSQRTACIRWSTIRRFQYSCTISIPSASPQHRDEFCGYFLRVRLLNRQTGGTRHLVSSFLGWESYVPWFGSWLRNSVSEPFSAEPFVVAGLQPFRHAVDPQHP